MALVGRVSFPYHIGLSPCTDICDETWGGFCVICSARSLTNFGASHQIVVEADMVKSEVKLMKLQILGCGYIGSVNAYCLADRASVSVYDIDPHKQQKFESRTPFFYETDLCWNSFFDRIAFGQFDGPDAIIVCVDAPVQASGYDITNIQKLLEKHAETPVILRTTLGPREIEVLSQSRHKSLYYWPEFLREGSAISDFHRDENFVSLVTGAECDQLVRSIVGEFTSLKDAKAAASVKFISNFYRALKVSFGNQIGVLLDENGIDQKLFFDVFFRLRGNCDSMYLRPGAPFGGHCLPKETAMAEDMLASHFAPEANLGVAVAAVNKAMIRKKIALIKSFDVQKVGISEFSFKKGTSDLRHSPTLALAEGLSKEMDVFDLDGSSAGLFPNLPDDTEVDYSFRGHSDW